MICQPDGWTKHARYVGRRLLLLACIAGAGLLGAGQKPGSGDRAWAAGEEGSFEFILLGDTPYSKIEEIAFEAMMAEIGRENFAFVVHVGDFKSGGSRCSDELFSQRLALFQKSVHPFVFVFGDNEWTDCHRSDAGGYDPAP